MNNCRNHDYSVSVVMATYNGEKYLHQQLKSILSQLTEKDEVIIVDDVSKDSTINIIQSFNDYRIKLYKNEINVGVIKSFNRGLGLVKNDIIFLSDQDDIWQDYKVETILATFVENQNICLIVSDASVIDSNGNIIYDSFMKNIGNFKYGLINNIIKNKFLGCTLAMRKTLLSFALPIPNQVPMHDIWLGCIGQLFGKIFFIDKQLIYYRRHNANVTKHYRSTIIQVLVWRLRLIHCLLDRYISIFIKMNIEKI